MPRGSRLPARSVCVRPSGPSRETTHRKDEHLEEHAQQKRLRTSQRRYADSQIHEGNPTTRQTSCRPSKLRPRKNAIHTPERIQLSPHKPRRTGSNYRASAAHSSLTEGEVCASLAPGVPAVDDLLAAPNIAPQKRMLSLAQKVETLTSLTSPPAPTRSTQRASLRASSHKEMRRKDTDCRLA
jgi:hypothetical protein